MNRTASRALAVALIASLAMAGVASAKGHDHKGTTATSGPAVTHGGGAKIASLKTKGNASHPGGVFRVLAIVHAAVDLRPATVDAIVHFASGDVAVVLTRSGQGSAYHAAVPVPTGEPAGVVLIDATATVDGAVLTATGQGKIVVPDNSAPVAPVAPAPTVAPSPSSCTPAPSDSADPSDSPDPSATAEPSESPDPSATAEPSGPTDLCASGSPTVTTTLTLPADVMARVLAFIESLLA
jgi:hypothetical protein